MYRQDRIAMANQTLSILEQGCYVSPQGNDIELAAALRGCITASYLVSPEQFDGLRAQLTPTASTEQTQFSVVNQTTLEAGKALLEKTGTAVSALNFASARNAGGGFLNGSEAQEESLARSSALYPTLMHHEEYYLVNRSHRSCLYTDYMIVSPAVPVFRDEEGALLESPYTLTFITAPAVNAGAVRINEPEHVSQIETIMAQRMEKLLCLCASRGDENLILGAWGCGVFQNDPAFIARTWQLLLHQNNLFNNRFKHVVFAVLDRSDRGMFQVFKQILA
jgi:uncharacterized protein (TIGR02452 family)